MKKQYIDTQKLYITQDVQSDSWFARTEKEKFARFTKNEKEWTVWLYPYNYSLHFLTLKESLRIIEKMYKLYWKENYKEEQ